MEVPRQQSLDLEWIVFGYLVRVRWLHGRELPCGLCLAHLVFPQRELESIDPMY